MLGLPQPAADGARRLEKGQRGHEQGAGQDQEERPHKLQVEGEQRGDRACPRPEEGAAKSQQREGRDRAAIEQFDLRDLPRDPLELAPLGEANVDVSSHQTEQQRVGQNRQRDVTVPGLRRNTSRSPVVAGKTA